MSFVAEHSAQGIDFTIGDELWAQNDVVPVRRRPSQSSVRSAIAGPSTSSSQTVRKASTHKRASTADGSIAHPLQDIPSSPSSSSMLSRTIGRRKRRADARSIDFSQLTNGLGEETGTDGPEEATGSKDKDPEVPVIVHKVYIGKVVL